MLFVHGRKFLYLELRYSLQSIKCVGRQVRWHMAGSLPVVMLQTVRGHILW